MIPISLTIQGLYSYQTKQTIDFSKLTQAGLFGIFGSVGCGKSTILEAISFALFGESERLNARDNRNYNMMNLKSNELLIDFEFKTGGEQRYRFIVKGKRNSKRFDDVKTFDRLAYKLVNNDWQPIEVSSAGQITGASPEPTATATPEPSATIARAGTTYRVQPGDSLAIIGTRFGIPWETIAAVRTWRGEAGYHERVARLQELVEGFEPRTLEQVAEI